MRISIVQTQLGSARESQLSVCTNQSSGMMIPKVQNTFLSRSRSHSDQILMTTIRIGVRCQVLLSWRELIFCSTIEPNFFNFFFFFECAVPGSNQRMVPSIQRPFSYYFSTFCVAPSIQHHSCYYFLTFRMVFLFPSDLYSRRGGLGSKSLMAQACAAALPNGESLVLSPALMGLNLRRNWYRGFCSVMLYHNTQNQSTQNLGGRR